MGVKHKPSSIRGIKLQKMGIAPPDDWSDIGQVRTAKKQEMGVLCTAAIYEGIEVGGKRYSLTAYDQTELMAQLSLVKEGAAAVPYHADGELCRMFEAAEFMEVANAAIQHIFYHRSYCNHLNAWIRDANMETLDKITYGAELPKKLAQSMADLFASAGGGGT